MNSARVFAAGRSQAVRLPRKYRFETEEVCITKPHDMVLYSPGKAWDLKERAIKGFTRDFMAERDQPSASQQG